MLAIFLKEIRSFLSSLIAYVVMIVFLISIGLFMWVLPDFNVLDAGYANVDVLFDMAPWIFIFLISAITMRSFSEEKKNGTIELITTKPIPDFSIILAKYAASVTLVLFTLISSIIYVFTIYQLGSPKGNIDLGAIAGSYIGLFLLAGSYASIGIFASVVTDNPIVSFVVSLFLCFSFYQFFDLLADFKLLGSYDSLVSSMGINSHYRSVSRGVIDSRDLLYFFSLNAVFLYATYVVFGSRKWS